MTLRPVALLFALVSLPVASHAQGHHDQNCTTKAAPPADLAAWSASAVGVTGARNQAGLAGAMVSVGELAASSLPPTAEVEFVVAPERAGGPGTHGGLFALDVREGGSYQIALGGGGWIDVVANGKAIASSAHRRGIACTGIGKVVTFPLEPGRHVIQISGSAGPKLSILVARSP